MPLRIRVSLCVVIGLFAVGSVSAQQKDAPQKEDCAYRMGRTRPAGHLAQRNDHPLRAPRQPGRQSVSDRDEEAAGAGEAAAERRGDGVPRAGDVGTYNEFWMDSGRRSPRPDRRRWSSSRPTDACRSSRAPRSSAISTWQAPTASSS